MKWGKPVEASARATLYTTVGILLVALTLLGCDYEDTVARAHTQGEYCLRSGPHPSQLAMWSEDGGVTWQR